jgi:hypothetical protein
MVGIRVGRWLSIPGRGSIFLFPTASKPALRPTQPTGGDYSGIKRQERETDHSLFSSAKVRKGGVILPLPHVFMKWCLIN